MPATQVHREMMQKVPEKKYRVMKETSHQSMSTHKSTDIQEVKNSQTSKLNNVYVSIYHFQAIIKGCFNGYNKEGLYWWGSC